VIASARGRKDETEGRKGMERREEMG